ncbi:hypothetical protein D3C80_1773870 [compost metagenome]
MTNEKVTPVTVWNYVQTIWSFAEEFSQGFRFTALSWGSDTYSTKVSQVETGVTANHLAVFFKPLGMSGERFDQTLHHRLNIVGWS